MRPLRPERIWRQAFCGAKPISSITRRTRCRVSSATSGLWLRMRETVVMETPLAAARSTMVFLPVLGRAANPESPLSSRSRKIEPPTLAQPSWQLCRSRSGSTEPVAGPAATHRDRNGVHTYHPPSTEPEAMPGGIHSWATVDECHSQDGQYSASATSDNRPSVPAAGPRARAAATRRR